MEGWEPPRFAGLYAILAADLNWAPKPFQPLYFGEFGNATPAAAFFQDCAALIKGAGKPNLFVAVLPMPFSTTSQRWAVCQELVRAYHPLCQAENEARSAVPPPLEWQVPPRRRIGFMPQTETA